MEMKSLPVGATGYAPEGNMPGEGFVPAMFQQYFGKEIHHGSVYLDALHKIDRRDEIKSNVMEEVKSALTTQSPLFATGTYYSSTSGSIPVLLPTVVDSTLYDVTKRDTPLASGLIPRAANQGLYADYIRRTALPTAVWAAEDAPLSDTKSTYDRQVSMIKFAYAVGRVTGPMLAASRKQWQDALKLETEAQYRALKELEENTIINGDTTAAAYEFGFNGLIANITTNTSDKSGGSIALSYIDTGLRTIRESRGHPTLIVTDYKTLTDTKQLMRDILIFQSGQRKLNFGFEEVGYEGIPIVPDLFMPTTGAARELLILDTTSTAGGPNIQIRTLQDAMFEELAKSNDSYKFMIKEYLTMIIIRESWCYRLYGLA